MAVQIAKASGAGVTGVCSSPTAGLVRSLGAGGVIDYTHDAIDGHGARYDVVIDTAGNRPPPLLRRAMTSRGTPVLVGGERGGGRLLGGFGRQLLRAPLVSLSAGQRLRGPTAKEGAADLQAITRLIDSGAVTPSSTAPTPSPTPPRRSATSPGVTPRARSSSLCHSPPTAAAAGPRHPAPSPPSRRWPDTARCSRPAPKPPIGTPPRPLPTRAPGNIRSAACDASSQQ